MHLINKNSLRREAAALNFELQWLYYYLKNVAPHMNISFNVVVSIEKYKYSSNAYIFSKLIDFLGTY